VTGVFHSINHTAGRSFYFDEIFVPCPKGGALFEEIKERGAEKSI
jgi:hypothetical protein